jgi:sugar phosphate isomerase/epimerase
VAAQIASAKTIGQGWVTVPSYPFPADAGLDTFKQAAAELNKWGEACRAQGLKLGYHNHDRELRDVGPDLTGHDVLLNETDPALVDFELDVYWATFAGKDPVALFERHPGRFAMWHVKDMRDPQGAKSMAPVGLGTIDYARVFANAARSGMRHFFVEHNDAAKWPGGSLASVQASFDGLRRVLA